jgi:hypothetical protein
MGRATVKKTFLALAAVMAVLVLPSAARAATCSSYSTQAEAQRAADTRDPDGDGIYCESLPCPCSTRSGGGPPPPLASPPPASSGCVRPSSVQRLVFSSSKYPNIKAHTLAAIRDGWPRILVVNRPGADERRDRLLAESGLPPRADQDRDEYPPAVGRGRANGRRRGLVRGINPIGWMASVMYIPDRENQSHGSSLGLKLRRFCNGVRFRYVFS